MDAHKLARADFDDGRTRAESWRLAQLRGLLDLLDTHGGEIEEALRADLGKPALEGWLTDIGACEAEINHMVSNLSNWMRPQKVRAPIVAQPAKASIVHEPLGVVLILAPWNYPVQLVVNPLAAALAAGNTAVVKPSEVAQACSALMAELLPRYVDGVQVVEGGVDVATALLAEPFDHIFFTGSTEVGKSVMRAAADHLTPVTLELGGKSPAIVDSSASVSTAASRIAWGKFLNAGQTCIAPDYVLVAPAQRADLVEALVTTVGKFYGSDPRSNPDFARIVSDRHLARLKEMLDDDHGGSLVAGGQVIARERYVAPTIVVDPHHDSKMMSEEIFGPVLPVISVADREQAIRFVNERPKPLALYAFGDDAAADEIIDRTSAGGTCVNHTMVHFAVPNLPFGGVGPSGMGRYHGRSGFETFSNSKSVLRRRLRPEHPLAYPPYTMFKRRILKRLLR